MRNVTKNNKPTFYWRWYVQGVLKHKDKLTFKKGTSVVSSERNRLDETNYSYFKKLRKRNSTGNWFYWGDLREYIDDDPGYKLKKISNTRCQMVKGK